MRKNSRKNDEIRKITIERNYIKNAAGSVLISMGNTKVICAATVTNKVPPHLKGKGTGWITAEYSMLPCATEERNSRERYKVGGRTQEIQRLIGRSLRSMVDLEMIGEQCIIIDCDVIQADGGTRTASINGGVIALFDALKKMKREKKIDKWPVKDCMGAISVGIVNGKPLVDLDYVEDSGALVDMNVVMTGSGKFVELQATGEENAFTEKELQSLVKLAKKGIAEVIEAQKLVLEK